MLASISELPPEGFKRVTLEQVLSADRKFWVLLAQETDGKVKRNDSGQRPCDESFSEVFKSHDFFMTLAPRQGSSAAGSRESPKAQSGSSVADIPRLSNADKKALKNQLKNEELKALRMKSQAGSKGQQQQTFSAKGGKKGQSSSLGNARMPPQLVGMCSKSSAASGMNRLCYGFNLGTCSAVAPGKQCQKGLHACMKPDPATSEACGGAHPCSACQK